MGWVLGIFLGIMTLVARKWGLALIFMWGLFLIVAGIMDWDVGKLNAGFFRSRKVNRLIHVGIGVLFIVLMVLIMLDIV